MTEANYWRTLRPRLNAYGMFRRIEDSSNSGTPDLSYCVRGTAGWAELKYLKELPPRIVRVKSLTREQVNFALEWEQNGGYAGLLLYIGGLGKFGLKPSSMSILYETGIASDEFRAAMNRQMPSVKYLRSVPAVVAWLTNKHRR